MKKKETETLLRFQFSVLCEIVQSLIFIGFGFWNKLAFISHFCSVSRIPHKMSMVVSSDKIISKEIPVSMAVSTKRLFSQTGKKPDEFWQKCQFKSDAKHHVQFLVEDTFEILEFQT